MTTPVPSSRSPDDAPQARFEALLDRHGGILRKATATYCRPPEDRRDLAQQITEPLWRASGRYDPDRPFSTWAYRVAPNVALSHVRPDSPRLGPEAGRGEGASHSAPLRGLPAEPGGGVRSG